MNLTKKYTGISFLARKSNFALPERHGIFETIKIEKKFQDTLYKAK